MSFRLHRAAVCAGASGVAVEPVALPAGFGWTPPFSVLRTGPGEYTTDIAPIDYVVQGTGATYYIATDGDDGNDGLSAGSPKANLSTLVAALNASPPSGGATIFMAPGYYADAAGLNGLSLSFDCNLICNGGKAVMMVTDGSGTWSSLGDNRWQQTGLTNSTADRLRAVVDLTDLNATLGVPRRLPRITGNTTTALIGNPGFCSVGETSVTVNLLDGREPDADVIVLDGGTRRVWRQTSARQIYMRNIEMWGGVECMEIDHAGAGYFFADGCRFSYSSGPGNGVEHSTSLPATFTSIFFGCDALYNDRDGFSSRGAMRHVEINCRGWWNGYFGVNGSDNGSTAHNTATSLRVGGSYRYNADRNLHDVNATQNLLYGCEAGDAQNGSAVPYDNFSFGVGSSTGTDATKMWLIECASLGGVTSDAVARGSSAVLVIDTGTGFDTTTELDGGTITILPEPSAWDIDGGVTELTINSGLTPAAPSVPVVSGGVTELTITG